MKEQGLPSPKKNKKVHHSLRETPFCSLVLDCCWDSQMTEKDIKSLWKQIEFSRHANLATPKNFKLYLTSLQGKLAERLEKDKGAKSWNDVSFEKRHYDEIFDKKSLVYLSSESENVLKTLDPTKSYIIGALVDHNRLKGITFEKAKKEGIETAKLPIAEYCELNSRSVISVNQVVELLVDFLNTNDWAKSVDKCIPNRKKKQKNEQDDKNGNQNDLKSINSSNDDSSDGEKSLNNLKQMKELEEAKEINNKKEEELKPEK